jgi:hypothetical protein
MGSATDGTTRSTKLGHASGAQIVANFGQIFICDDERMNKRINVLGRVCIHGITVAERQPTVLLLQRALAGLSNGVCDHQFNPCANTVFVPDHMVGDVIGPATMSGGQGKAAVKVYTLGAAQKIQEAGDVPMREIEAILCAHELTLMEGILVYRLSTRKSAATITAMDRMFEQPSQHPRWVTF